MKMKKNFLNEIEAINETKNHDATGPDIFSAEWESFEIPVVFPLLQNGALFWQSLDLLDQACSSMRDFLARVFAPAALSLLFRFLQGFA
jgi:hypothetical protein